MKIVQLAEQQPGPIRISSVNDAVPYIRQNNPRASIQVVDRPGKNEKVLVFTMPTEGTILYFISDYAEKAIVQAVNSGKHQPFGAINDLVEKGFIDIVDTQG